MKTKLLLSLIIAGTLSNCVYAKDYIKNDLRTLFLNNQAVIYEINMRSFNAQDKNGNEIIEVEKGDVRGNFLNAIDRLDELKNYGINTIHLMPINPVGRIASIGTAGSVYAMLDIAAIDQNLIDKNSKLTDKQQFKKFISECHKRGIRVMVDIPACGSAEMALEHPDLFILDKNGKAIIPVDWTDVRLFKTVNADGSLNQDLLNEHKKYVDMLVEAGADGIRADVAPIKPQGFWAELIKYARAKDPEFMFLAETAEAWAPPKVPTPTAIAPKLLNAGFDGYYGNALNYLNFKSPKDFEFMFKLIGEFAKNGEKKAIIGCFNSHDLKSVYLKSKEFAEAIMYMNATLPLNPYYVDGFQSGDKYDYSYSGKTATRTYTDNMKYYTHKNKIDIFNYSRRPGGNLPEMQTKLKETITLRENLGDLVTKGDFNMLKTSNKKVYAYKRQLGNDALIVVVSNNQLKPTDTTVNIKNIKMSDCNVLTTADDYSVNKDKMKVKLKAGQAFAIKFKVIND